nr:hypothetical protein [Escherichia coli]
MCHTASQTQPLFTFLCTNSNPGRQSCTWPRQQVNKQVREMVFHLRQEGEPLIFGRANLPIMSRCSGRNWCSWLYFLELLHSV